MAPIQILSSSTSNHYPQSRKAMLTSRFAHTIAKAKAEVPEAFRKIHAETDLTGCKANRVLIKPSSIRKEGTSQISLKEHKKLEEYEQYCKESKNRRLILNKRKAERKKLEDMERIARGKFEPSGLEIEAELDRLCGWKIYHGFKMISKGYPLIGLNLVLKEESRLLVDNYNMDEDYNLEEGEIKE